MSLSAEELLRHILDEVVFLLETSSGLKYEKYITDGIVIRAFERSLEIIGDATKKLPREFRDIHNDIDWKGMAGLRDKLIHNYFGVDHELVWEIVTSKIPSLKSQITNLLNL